MTNVLFKVPYGSKLYGTNTPTSDEDFKAIYLPKLTDMLRGKKLQTFKKRFDADGNVLSDDNAPMPANGVEVEYIPFQTFVRDFVAGQTYAVEVAWSLYPTLGDSKLDIILRELVTRFANDDVHSMVGFAMKQTFDYVHRGVRLEKARALQQALNVLDANDLARHYDEFTEGKPLRLDHVVHGEKVLHTVARAANLELGTTVNNNRTLETLKLNGRDYLETTTIDHLLTAVEKLVNSYGHRTQAAAEQAVDLKSLMHAVRVYQQALELLETGQLTFPRPNRDQLLSVKSGQMPAEEVRELLLNLDRQCEDAALMTTVRSRTPQLTELAEEWLTVVLVVLYELDPSVLIMD